MPKITSNSILDIKELRKVEKKLSNLEDYEVQFGYWDEDVHPEHGLGMATLASIHEFGGVTESGASIPARDFMHQTMIEYSGRQGNHRLKVIVEDYLFHKVSIRAALNKAGKEVTNKIVWVVEQGGVFEANAQSTIDQKGSDTPLVESGHMRDSAKHKIVKKLED